MIIILNKYFYTILIGMLGILFLIPVSLAQDVEGEVFPAAVVVAHIQSENSVEVGRNIIFNAKNSVSTVPDADIKFLWQFGDGSVSDQEEVVHIYSKPGVFNVRLSVDATDPKTKEAFTSEMTKEVFVYTRALIIVTDLESRQGRIDALLKNAEEENVYLRVLDTSKISGQRKPANVLVEENIDIIGESEVLILWSDQIETLTVFNQLRDRFSFSSKDIVVISEGSLGVVKGVMKGVFSVINPHRILLTRREALDEFITTSGDEDIAEVILKRGYDFELLTAEIMSKRTLWELPSIGIQFLQQQGLSDSALLYLLLLGVIVTLITFLKIVIGLASVGLRIPVVITYLFLVMGWSIGLFMVVVLMAFAMAIQRLIKKQYLLYTAKVAVMVSFLSLLLLFLIGAVVYFQWYEFSLSSVLLLIVVGVLMERLVGVEAEHGFLSTIRILAETLLVTFISYWVVSFAGFQLLLLAHPEILILFVLANLLMGRFTGLRLMEYFRFREVLRYTEEE